jgi:hypothetical protein
MPLRHLIALIINAHPARRGRPLRAEARFSRDIDRKTSLRDRSDDWRSGTADIQARPSPVETMSFPIESTRAHARINPLFTMSDNPRNSAGPMPDDTREFVHCGRDATPKRSNEMHQGVAAAPGGARRDRTDDLLLAKQALSQLSYGPFREQGSAVTDQDKPRCAALTTDA